jgi:manganese oxidase
MNPRARKEDPFGFGIATSVFTLLTVMLSVSALFVGASALSKSDTAESQANAAAGPAISLTEFVIDPVTPEVGVDGAVRITNNGKAEHNLTVKGHDLHTADLKAGESEVLDLSDLGPGSYEIFCSLPGHASSGMQGVLTIGASGTASHAAHDAEDENLLAQNDTLDEQQASPVQEYVDQLENGANTEGTGAQLLEPKVLADGTKQFDLTTEVVDWEVEPGKKVRAWAYNGTVPGPTIKVQPGERVRIVLDNQLPQSTAIHFHGIETPNAMDGVPYVTQDPVKPGKKFTYEFVARGPAVGMYHSHHHAEHQVPDGLLGAFIVGDEPLPSGVTISQEVPMVLNDAGVIGLSLNGKSFPATAPTIAKQGDWVLVHYMNEGLQMHPMHLHGLPQLVIAKDGFPLAAPYSADTVAVAPGERYSVLVHATTPGVWAWHCHILNHAERESGMFGMVTTFIVQ